VAPQYTVELNLRTFTGDLFVLFEVMNEESYDISEDLFPSDRVRVILDCGANIGITSIYLAARYPLAQIYSIEPDLENFNLLRANTQAEPRITAIHAASVGRPRQTVWLTTNMEAWRNKISLEGDGASVPAITIEEICEQYGISQIDLLKMDIEGAEAEVLPNGSFLNRVRFLIAELHGDYGHSDFTADVQKYGLVAARGGELPGVRLTSARR
jgi:FkbM family methyltransferase